MKDALGKEVINFSLDDNSAKEQLVSKLKNIDLVSDITSTDEKITVFASKGTEVIPQIFQISSELKMKINSISLTQPTLDDVFISYTGRDLRDESGNYNRKREHAKMKRLRV